MNNDLKRICDKVTLAYLEAQNNNLLEELRKTTKSTFGMIDAGVWYSKYIYKLKILSLPYTSSAVYICAKKRNKWTLLKSKSLNGTWIYVSMYVCVYVCIYV
jgi:hypothetical protein